MKVKYPVLFSAALTALSAFSAIEAVNVKLRQDWPWSNAVTLTYDLSGVSEPHADNFGHVCGGGVVHSILSPFLVM